MTKGIVLVVHDEASLVEMMKLSLEKAGYEVLTACNGFEAIGAVRAEEPDIVILDALLPGKNGYEVSKLLRKDQVDGCIGKALKIIILTAIKPDSHRDAQLSATWARADEYLYKPFEMEELISLVEKHAPTIRNSG